MITLFCSACFGIWQRICIAFFAMNTIRTSEHLRAVIEELRLQSNVQEAAIKARFSGPKAIFKTLISLFPHSTHHKGWKSWVRPALRIVPAVAIRLFFRRSSFILKSLVGLTGQLSSRFIK